MAVNLSLRPNHHRLSPTGGSPSFLRPPYFSVPEFVSCRRRSIALPPPLRRMLARARSSRADDSAPYEMSLENARLLLGVSEGASFDEVLRAKNSILSTCKDEPDAIAQVEAAYDMILMQSLSQRRAGKVASSRIRYADVKPVTAPGMMGSMPKWLQTTVKNAPVSVESPVTTDLGIQAGVYGALVVLTYANGTSVMVPGTVAADVPGLLLASSFGASLYFMTKKKVKLGKAAVITLGGLVAGAVLGSAVESWLQVDIVPFLGLHSPAAVISEFIIISQFLVSVYLR
ncbi:Protein CHAPERONE-LIKE PROTEIN OF POR1, chloroplastic [Linum perenne]